MSRIIVLGYELPALAAGAVEARSYRTWQFVESLLGEDHEVCLVVSHKTTAQDVPQSLSPNLTYHRLNMRVNGWVDRLNAIHDAFRPDCVLAVTFNSCMRATRLRTSKPIWMDIYGDKVAETQIAEWVAGNARGRRNMMRYFRQILRRGDVFSTCGTPQLHALIGQLSMAGRLNRHTTGHEMVYPILPGASGRIKAASAETIRGTLVPDDAFVVLWAGGYNVWIDPETLFSALDEAMSRCPNLVFLSVGASTTPQPNNPYERFQAQIQQSPHQARYILQGWQPASVIPDYYRAADVGISLDAYHYETILGTRTRLVEMMGYGLPIITTIGCELSMTIRDQNLGLTFPIGDAACFRDNILKLASDSSLRQQMSERSQQYAASELSFSETTRSFTNWVRDPHHAPDHLPHDSDTPLQQIEFYLRYIARGILWRFWALENGD